MQRRSSIMEQGTSNDEPLVNLNARVPKHLWRRVRLRCLEDNRLLRSFITEALTEHLRARARGGVRR